MNFLERALDGQNHFGKYLGVILLGVILAQIVGAIPLVIVASVVGATDPLNMVEFGISKNWSLFLAILPFVCTLFFTIWLIKEMHKRTFSETVNGTRKIRFGRIGIGAAVWAILMAIYVIIDYSLDPKNFVMQLDWTKFVGLIVLTLFLIPLQTTAEEVVFRGYLTQGIATWTKNRWVAILIPGLLFGLMHFANPEIEEFGFWITMPQYVFFGLLWGLISVLDDGIELAIGMHAANNVFLSIFLTHSSSAMQTDALFEMQQINPAKELIVLIAVGLIAFAYFAHRYKWNFAILNQKVEKEQSKFENEQIDTK
jgi:membrane protease YdiL (CAAX protease family)